VEFNLVDEAWLPVVCDGESQLMGLRAVLVRAHRISSLGLGFPAQIPALLRQLLIPILLDAGLVPVSYEQWADWFNAGEFSPAQDSKVEAYLAEHRGAFDLFDPVRPFGQVAQLATGKDTTSSIAQLIAPVASGNNVPIFSAYTDADDLQLSPGEAALWLLHAQCWDTAGIKPGAVGDPAVKAGKTTGNPTGPLGGLGVVVPTGRTLHETLLLNLPVRYGGLDPRDAPQWRRPSTSAWQQRSAVDVMDLLTWQSRRIRLIPAESEHGIVVNRVVMTAGDRLGEMPEWEPHTLWRRGADVKGRPDVVRPRRHSPGRAAWRGLDSLIAMDLPAGGEGALTSRLLRQLGEIQAEELIDLGHPVDIEVHGYKYGTMSAIFEDNVFDSLPLPVLALTGEGEVREAVLRIAAQAGELEGAVNRLAADLRRAAGGDPVPWDKGQRPGTLLIHALDLIVRETLSGLGGADVADTITQLLTDWEIRARRATDNVAADLLARVAPETFGGRQKDGHTYRAANAERVFRAAVAKILPRAAEARRAD
jgi:CRISPR system Cascade subunit CasA